MFRNSILYRRLWYLKRRRTRTIHTFIRLISISIILLLLVFYTEKTLIPHLLEFSELKSRAVITDVINRTFETDFSRDIGYGDLITIHRDIKGQITSIQADVVKMNLLSTQIASRISEQMALLKNDPITVPLGMLVGNELLESHGPGIRTKTIPSENVETDFRSEYVSSGKNQTCHKIYLEVRTKVGIETLFAQRQTEVSVTIPVAETVIVGELPEM